MRISAWVTAIAQMITAIIAVASFIYAFQANSKVEQVNLNLQQLQAFVYSHISISGGGGGGAYGGGGGGGAGRPGGPGGNGGSGNYVLEPKIK